MIEKLVLPRNVGSGIFTHSPLKSTYCRTEMMPFHSQKLEGLPLNESSDQSVSHAPALGGSSCVVAES